MTFTQNLLAISNGATPGPVSYTIDINASLRANTDFAGACTLWDEVIVLGGFVTFFGTERDTVAQGGTLTVVYDNNDVVTTPSSLNGFLAYRERRQWNMKCKNPSTNTFKFKTKPGQSISNAPINTWCPTNPSAIVSSTYCHCAVKCYLSNCEATSVFYTLTLTVYCCFRKRN